MKWYSSISHPHVQYWSRMVKTEYAASLQMWLSVKNRPPAVRSQIDYYDWAPLGKQKSKICCWKDIVTRATDQQFNPLQIVYLAFESSLTENRSEYPRPNQIPVPRELPRLIAEKFDFQTEIRIKSDLTYLTRCRESVDVMFGDAASPEDVLAATASLLNENLSSHILRAALASSQEKPPGAAIREFLRTPGPFKRLVPQFLHPYLKTLRYPDGSSIL